MKQISMIVFLAFLGFSSYVLGAVQCPKSQSKLCCPDGYTCHHHGPPEVPKECCQHEPGGRPINCIDTQNCPAPIK